MHTLWPFNQSIKKKKKSPIIASKQHSLKNLDMEDFLQDAATVTWEKINSFSSLEESWSLFKNSFSLIMNKHAYWKKI